MTGEIDAIDEVEVIQYPPIEYGSLHVSRTFEGSRIEDACPCKKEPCGFVSMDHAAPECEHHPFHRAKTMRRLHFESNCPGPQHNVRSPNE